MNREAQRLGSTYSGVEGIAIQGGSLQESMVGVDPVSGERVAWGGICDRTREVLAPTDRGIMLARRKIFEAIEQVAKGGTPEGMDPQTTRFASPRSCWTAGRPTRRRPARP